MADEPIIRSHPAWQKLERHCACEIRSIDDLITQGNHTATITLAFERALRQSGDAMRDTCFIFLMSDYLVADGSLKTVLRKIETGAGAVLAGNFQIIAEDAAPLLRQRLDLELHEIVLPPRDLVRWSLAHLHPATVANIVNFGLTHNAHSNRLFWRVDENCLIGRFYLMHPIAIHPETSDFVVGSSWDYSFVPELCPSGNIAALTDSDDYLVVELQRRDYEWENLRPGPVVAAELAQSLAEWTTDYHRRNVTQTVVFHAADRPADLAQFIARSDAFVENVRQSLASPALSHRRHPYWVGSIAVNRRRSHRPLGKEDWSFLLSEKAGQSSLRRLRAKLFGSPPEVTRLHPLWPDYRLPLKALNDILSSQRTRAVGGSRCRAIRALDRGHGRRRRHLELRSPAAIDPRSIQRTCRNLRRLCVVLRRCDARSIRCAHRAYRAVAQGQGPAHSDGDQQPVGCGRHRVQPEFCLPGRPASEPVGLD